VRSKEVHLKIKIMSKEIINKIKINIGLYTKDGRSIGNSICIKIGHHALDAKNFLIKTDYGDQCWLTSKEISDLFYIGNIVEPSHKHFTK